MEHCRHSRCVSYLDVKHDQLQSALAAGWGRGGGGKKIIPKRSISASLSFLLSCEINHTF